MQPTTWKSNAALAVTRWRVGVFLTLAVAGIGAAALMASTVDRALASLIAAGSGVVVALVLWDSRPSTTRVPRHRHWRRARRVVPANTVDLRAAGSEPVAPIDGVA